MPKGLRRPRSHGTLWGTTGTGPGSARRSTAIVDASGAATVYQEPRADLNSGVRAADQRRCFDPPGPLE